MFSVRVRAVTLKPGPHLVVRIAEHVPYDTPRKILRLSAHQLHTVFVKYEYLPSLQLCEDQGIREKLENRVQNNVLAIFTTYMGTRL